MKVMTDAALVHSEPVKRFVRASLMRPFLPPSFRVGCVTFEEEEDIKRHLSMVSKTNTNDSAFFSLFLHSDFFLLFFPRVYSRSKF